MRTYQESARVFKALCDPKRLAILEQLRSGEKCACVLQEPMDLTQSGLSYHMKILCDSAGGGATVYHAGTALADNVLVTSGGRVLGVTAVADSLSDAVAAAYGAADQIGFEGLHRRSDIGQKALAAL